MKSAIYTGTLRHRRFRPVRHDFTYSIFMVLLDIDQLSTLMRISPFTGHNRWNWASFYDEDHFGDLNVSLRERLARDAQQHGIELPSGPIFLLTHLRYLGYNFNPVSFFYCCDHNNRLQTILAEVNNTFGETHNYWLTAKDREGNPEGDSHRYHFQKQFHVSPFLEMNCGYEWTFTEPAELLVVQSNSLQNGEPIFDSTLKLEAQEWTPRNLHRILLRYPWITMKVIAGIHWQAVRLLARKVPVVHHPGAGHFRPANKRHFGAAWSPGVQREPAGAESGSEVSHR
jgi:uncharacterized protein